MYSGTAGYSLTEMIVVLSAIGILAGIAISSVTGTSLAARETIAREKLEMLNRGVHTHQQTNGLKNLESQLAIANNGWDERSVLQLLQYRDPSNPTLGSPYVPPSYRPQISASSNDFRLEWTGVGYKLLVPGQTGTGLKVPFDGSDHGKPYVYPPNWNWSAK
jgi:prepilin-type N-terminal cleavage/methylation domain-containing protein